MSFRPRSSSMCQGCKSATTEKERSPKGAVYLVYIRGTGCMYTEECCFFSHSHVSTAHILTHTLSLSLTYTHTHTHTHSSQNNNCGGTATARDCGVPVRPKLLDLGPRPVRSKRTTFLVYFVKLSQQEMKTYQLKCKECPEQYVGETGRFLETRLEEHNGEARRQELDKPWGQHFRTTHPGCKLNYGQSAFSAVEVIGREPDRARRKLREAIEIRDAKPHVNISTGWDLL